MDASLASFIPKLQRVFPDSSPPIPGTFIGPKKMGSLKSNFSDVGEGFGRERRESSGVCIRKVAIRQGSEKIL